MIIFFFRRSTHWKVSQQTGISVNHHSNASDWQICENKQEFSNFWAMNYCFVLIVVLIIILMHFVLLTTISLPFVWERHFWLISPPCTCLNLSENSSSLLKWWRSESVLLPSVATRGQRAQTEMLLLFLSVEQEIIELSEWYLRTFFWQR